MDYDVVWDDTIIDYPDKYIIDFYPEEFEDYIPEDYYEEDEYDN